MRKEYLYLVSFVDHLMYDHFAYKVWAEDADEATEIAIEKYACGDATWEWTKPAYRRDGSVPERESKKEE